MTDKSLEERTNSKLESIENLMKNADSLFGDRLVKSALHFQNQALYKQNQIIIDYLREMYKEMKK